MNDDLPENVDEFDAGGAPTIDGKGGDTPGVFVVDLEGFEGPLDVLLTLARDHKLDLTQISILELADQYLAFIQEVRKRSLEIAADYLVMAAWLAYLKSRLLLPDLTEEDEPTGEEMAAALRFQIRRLEAMQGAGQGLLSRPRLGRDFFARGEPERFPTTQNTILDVTLYDLLNAYARHRRAKAGDRTLHIEPFEIYTVDDALMRLRKLMGRTPDWQSLWAYLPDELKEGLFYRSAVASTFAASLELAKEGKVRIRQGETYGDIYLQAADRQQEDVVETAQQRDYSGEDGQ